MKKKKYPELAAEMAKRGDTQKVIGELLNLPSGSITRRLAGEIEWSISEINKICKYYQKSYEELFKEEVE